MQGYTDQIRYWAVNNRRAGTLSNADGIGEVGLESHEIGRRLAVRFMLKVELDRVADARYEVFGCGFSMAACAVAADLVVGCRLKDITGINAMTLDQILEGLPDERQYCADLAIEALHAAARSALDGNPVTSTYIAKEDNSAELRKDHVVYKSLMTTPCPGHISPEDRHFFACLLCVAKDEDSGLASSLGLDDTDIDSILSLFFPGFDLTELGSYRTDKGGSSVRANEALLQILLDHVPLNGLFNETFVSYWVARIIAARASLEGHLWVAMGLTERSQLTAAIQRHLPSLAEANNKKMRWKKFLYKQLCDLNGGTMCKAPNCGVCSDYALCFAD